MCAFRLMGRRPASLGGVVLAAHAVLVLAACSGTADPVPDVASATQVPRRDSLANDFVLPPGARGVVVAPAAGATIPDYLDLPARVAADPTRLVQVFAPVSGRLTALLVRPADAVRAGQVLARLQSSDVAQARAAYRQAAADAEVKQRNVERAHALWQNDAIAHQEVQQAEADARAATAALESARERLALLNIDSLGSGDEIAIRAPRAGIVLDVGAAPGQFLKSLDNATPLCTVADLSSVWALGDVYEKDVATVRAGDRVQVLMDAWPAARWSGRIDAMAGTMDSTTRTVKVRVVLRNRGLELKPDMFGTIRLARAARAAVVVPQASVLREGATNYVFIQESRGRFRQRAVTLGRDLDGDRVQVLAGLQPGDHIIVQGASLVRLAATSP